MVTVESRGSIHGIMRIDSIPHDDSMIIWQCPRCQSVLIEHVIQHKDKVYEYGTCDAPFCPVCGHDTEMEE